MPDGEVFVYKHVGDRPLRLAEDAVEAYLPGAEVRTKEPIVSNGNFEAVSDNAKAHQAQVDAEDAERLKVHRASIGYVEPEPPAASVDEAAPAKRARKSAPAETGDPVATPAATEEA